jgi:AcrR family transcriptional regulator
MKTKDKIVMAALHLFNEHGTAQVSTNHIAEAAGISPGNLYYHYNNKEEIIRAICERLFEAWDRDLSELPEDRLPTLEDVKRIVRKNFEITSEYAFVHRELLALLRHDPALHERYLEVRERGYQGFRALVDIFAAAGVLRSVLDDHTITQLADLIWLVNESWLTALELQGKPADAENMQRGVDLMFFVLQPYLVQA